MISVETALKTILDSVDIIGTEKVKLLDTLDSVLAEDVYSDIDIPPFDNSGVDGYAVKFEDIKNASQNFPIVLQSIANIPAGSYFEGEIKNGQCASIMTGAPIPKGTDAVVMVENTEQTGDNVTIFSSVKNGENVRRSGEDIKKDTQVLKKGTVLRPAEIGVLASLGKSEVLIYKKPVVAVLCTGDELIDPDEKLSIGKIRNTNTYTLISQIKKVGAIPLSLGVAKDTKSDVEEKLKKGLSADVIITSAGVSVGKYDYVKTVLEELGMKSLFWKIAIRPGKPVVFGLIDKKPVFGLPGNPVSSMLGFELFVRPALLKMMGKKKLKRPEVQAKLLGNIEKKAGLEFFIRGIAEKTSDGWTVKKTGAQGSNILTSMSLANCLIVLSSELSLSKTGEFVKVILIDENEVE
jgi:molybdopterin molybdotransferase